MPTILDPVPGSIISYIKANQEENPEFKKVSDEISQIGHDISWTKQLVIDSVTSKRILDILQKAGNFIRQDQTFAVQNDPNVVVALKEILQSPQQYIPLIASQIHKTLVAQWNHDNNYNGQAYFSKKREKVA